MKKLFIFILFTLNINCCWALRCNGALVYEGDSQATVEKECGEPQDKKVLTTTQPLINDAGVTYGSVPFLTEVWTYQASPQDFMYQVYFTDKQVTSITANRHDY